jgi:hypothetical protein
MEKVVDFPEKNFRKLRSKNSEFSRGEISAFPYRAQNPARPHLAINILFFARYHVPAKRSQAPGSASHLSFEIMGYKEC